MPAGRQAKQSDSTRYVACYFSIFDLHKSVPLKARKLKRKKERIMLLTRSSWDGRTDKPKGKKDTHLLTYLLRYLHTKKYVHIQYIPPFILSNDPLVRCLSNFSIKNFVVGLTMRVINIKMIEPSSGKIREGKEFWWLVSIIHIKTYINNGLKLNVIKIE